MVTPSAAAGSAASPEPPGSSRPRRADAQRNRQLLISVAAKVFAEDGLEASFDEIARRAGVGVGTVYRHFPDRDDLVDALFAERVDAVVETAASAAEMSDTWAGLVRFLELTIEAQAGDRGLQQVLRGGARGRERLAGARLRVQPAVDLLVERAQQSGDLHPDVASSDLAVLATALSALATPAQPELWRRYLAVLLQGLRPTGSDLPLRPPLIEVVGATVPG